MNTGLGDYENLPKDTQVGIGVHIAELLTGFAGGMAKASFFIRFPGSITAKYKVAGWPTLFIIIF